MATDAITGQPIFSGHRSWGRTRGPKNIAGAHGTAVAIVAHNALPSGITATDGTAGYATENQRYLHVTVAVSAVTETPGRDLNVWTYSHASGVWATFAQIDCDAIQYNTTFVVAIYGADRVAIQRNAGAFTTDQTPTVYAACSTF